MVACAAYDCQPPPPMAGTPPPPNPDAPPAMHSAAVPLPPCHHHRSSDTRRTNVAVGVGCERGGLLAVHLCLRRPLLPGPSRPVPSPHLHLQDTSLYTRAGEC